MLEEIEDSGNCLIRDQSRDSSRPFTWFQLSNRWRVINSERVLKATTN